MNPEVKNFHDQHGHAGFKFLVTAWSVEQTGGRSATPGGTWEKSHAHLNVSQRDFDVVALEIASTSSYVGVPDQEHKEFMDIIERYRSMVVAVASAPAMV
ncbi:MAG: group 1 truncated hemoglobin [Actinomycetota bacterium]|nr:group 1 truncated hemoglobin [Actinomycetota bacterium]